MTVHIVVLLIICILAILCIGKKNGASLRRKKQFIIWGELIIFFVIAFRSPAVGLDTETYYRYFNALIYQPGYFNRLGWEPLFILIVRIGIYLNSFQFVLIICAAITCIGFGIFIYHNTSSRWAPFWYLFFYITLNLYFNSFHLMRQICAMAIAANAFTILRKGKNKKSIIKAILLLVIGSGFHMTAAIFSIPLVLAAYWEKVDRRKIGMAFLAVFIGGIFLTFFQNLLIRYVGRYSTYANDARLSLQGISVFQVLMLILKSGTLLYIISVYSPNNQNNNMLYRLAFINVFGLGFYVLMSSSQFALRLSYWYEMFFPLYLSEFVERFKNPKTKRVLYFALFLFGLIYFIYMMQFGGIKSNRGTVPYTFIWQWQ